MGAEEIKEDKSVIKAFDSQFLEMFNSLSLDAINKAGDCTERVFSVTKDFLEKDATEVLRQFHELYFGGRSVDERKEDMNRSVDDMIDAIQANLESGKDAEHGIEEDAAAKKERLGLSGLQKQLEGLITMDEGIRDKVVPALSSMQFEDAVRQRLEHIVFAWVKTFDEVNSPSDADLKSLGETIGDVMTSVEETEQFFRIVLRKEPPERGVDSGLTLLF